MFDLISRIQAGAEDHDLETALITAAQSLRKTVLSSQRHVAVLGGSFNPTTLGHAALIRLLLHQDYDLVSLIPTGQSPLKSPDDYASVVDRLNMLNLVLQTACTPEERQRLRIETIETDRRPPSKMVVTLGILISLHQAQEHYSLICGYDHLAQMDHWYRWQELAGLCDIVFYPRAQVDILTPRHRACVRNMMQAGLTFKIIFADADKKMAFDRYCEQSVPETALIEDPQAAILPSSATDIRDYYQRGVNTEVIPDGLSMEVHRYILAHHLFINSANITPKKNSNTKPASKTPPGTR